MGRHLRQLWSKTAAFAPGPVRRRLSAQLLLLTILFVMIAEVLIFVPSIANFRDGWLKNRLAAAQIATLALEATPDDMVSDELKHELLANAEVLGVVLYRDAARRLILSADMPPKIDAHFDLRLATAWSSIRDTFATLAAGDGRIIRIIGAPRFEGGDFIEIVVTESPLRAAMAQFGINILSLSIIISVVTASLVYLALHRVLVRPMRRITENMLAFRENPEDARRVIEASAREDEIGVAERELAAMQREIRSTLSQKARLAALGGAVAKINHDLRNILASTQLLSDRLGAVKDPTVQSLTPRLFAAIDRAIDLCTKSLKFGRAEEAVPARRRLPLANLVTEVAQAVGLPDKDTEDAAVRWLNQVPDDVMIDADPDQLFRILLNLGRNAVQAVELERDGGEIRVTARRDGDRVRIDMTDTGPGLPPAARAHLFEAFSGSARAGGTGLGLAIAAELARAHGGDIVLVESGAGGTTFRIIIPDRQTPRLAASADSTGGPAPKTATTRR